MSKKSIKIDEDALLKVVTKAINESLDNDNKDEKEKVESNKDQEQWHDEYVNNDDNDVVQARINPKSGKEEYKIPTRDTVFTTKDAAISALNEEKTKRFVKRIVNEVMNELSRGVINRAANKMYDMNQNVRANNLIHGYRKVIYDNNDIKIVRTLGGVNVAIGNERYAYNCDDDTWSGDNSPRFNDRRAAVVLAKLIGDEVGASPRGNNNKNKYIA